MRTAIIIGGGLAGLTAARTLAMSGRFRPLVLESAPVLGGKAASWRDETGALIEAGLHVCFPYYTNLLGLLAELGQAHRIAWGDSTFNFVSGEGEQAKLQFSPLPPPLHAAVAVARHAQLRAGDCLSALVGAAEATMSTRGWRARYEPITFASWARKRGLSRRLMDLVFEPMVGGLTFLRSDEVSARAMLDYLHAVGCRAKACRVGLFRGGSGEVIVEPLAADVVRRGGEIRLQCSAAALEMEDGRVVGVQLSDGGLLRAPMVIAAVPGHALRSLAPAVLRDQVAMRKVERLQPVPVASAIVWFDRRVGGPPGLRFSSGCVFNTWCDMAELLPELAASNRSVLQLVLAPMAGLAGLDDAALSARVIADIRRVLPGARAARVDRLALTHTPRAFHAVVPGAEALRPCADIGVPGLLLAGDYTRAGHSPNMEAAVKSGLQAARLALEAVA